MVLSASKLDHADVPVASPRHSQSPVLRAFGAAVRKARLERGISQEALAFEAGIDRSYMSSVERGGQNIGLVHSVQIAKALGVTLASLVESADL